MTDTIQADVKTESGNQSNKPSGRLGAIIASLVIVGIVISVTVLIVFPAADEDSGGFGTPTPPSSIVVASIPSPTSDSGFDLTNPQLQLIWNNPRLFEAWLKGNHSLSRLSNPLSQQEAMQIYQNAKKLGNMTIDTNPTGLVGKEVTAQWAGVPHFKINSVHIPVQKGVTLPYPP